MVRTACPPDVSCTTLAADVVSCTMEHIELTGDFEVLYTNVSPDGLLSLVLRDKKTGRRVEIPGSEVRDAKTGERLVPRWRDG